MFNLYEAFTPSPLTMFWVTDSRPVCSTALETHQIPGRDGLLNIVHVPCLGAKCRVVEGF